MPYLNVRGVKHYYEWIRKYSRETAKPKIIFIHGWAGSARYWKTTAQTLSEKFDCLLYDLRGFGRSVEKVNEVDKIAVNSVNCSSVGLDNSKISAAVGYEMEDYASDLAFILDSLEIERSHIIAHSMGASVATLFLNCYPERVDKAILTCSGVFEYDEKAFSAFHRFGSYVVKFRPKWLGKIPFVDKIFMARFLSSPIPVDERKAFLQDFLQADYDAALGTIFTSVSKAQAELMPAEFAKLRIPTLLISGEYDQIIPAKLGYQAAALNSNVLQIATIKNTGHFPMLEDPSNYLKLVQKFLN
ncbi:MAG: alpha/beta hydrolase [Cyanobacteria bacterium P01_A01_bin.84]